MRAAAFAAVLGGCLLAPVAARADDPASARNRAAALLDNGEEEKALELFRDIAKKLPDSVPDRVNLGIALLNRNELDGAEAEFRKVLQKDANELRARYNLGLVLKRKGKNEEAAENLAIVAASPEGQKDAAVHYNLGIVSKRLRRADDALAAFRKVAALRPEHASAHFQIYNDLVQRGEKEKALPELELFKILQKATPDFQRTEAYLERGAFTRILAPGPLPPGARPAGKGAAAEAQIRFELKAAAAPVDAGGGKAAASKAGAEPPPSARSDSRAAQRSEGAASSAGDAGPSDEERARAAQSEIMESAAAPEGAPAPLMPPSAALLVDLDGDGRPELVQATPAEPVLVLQQKPAGVFSGRLATLELPGDSAAAPSPGHPRQGSSPQSTMGGAASGRRGTALAGGDVDNDGDADLAVVTAGGVKLYLNDGKGKFKDATPGSGLEKVLGGGGAAWVDVDRDGDLDLVVGGDDSEKRPPQIYLNASVYPSAGAGGGESAAVRAGADRTGAGVPRFIPAGPEASLPPCGEGLAFSDLRGRDDPDLIFACADGRLAIARNLRGGRFEVEWAGKTAGRAVLAPADLDADGENDLIVLAGSDLHVLWNDPRSAGAMVPPRPLFEGGGAGSNLAAFALLDADGDGDLDVAAVGRERDGGRRLVLLRNDGARRFTPLSDIAPPLPSGSSVLLEGDVDGDGDPDLVGLPPAYGLINATKSANRFLRIALNGVKSNRGGVGAKIEVRAERLVVRRESDGRPVIVGIGPRGRADAVQVVWPTGVSQDLIDVGAGAVLIEEKREFAGSCPFLYAWDGSRFRFIAEALSGAPVGFLRPDGTLETPRPREHLRLPPGLPVERDGFLSLRMTEEMREITALDSVRLVAVDHPLGTEVYSNERLTEKGPEPFRFLVLGDLRTPTAAAEAVLALRSRAAAVETSAPDFAAAARGNRGEDRPVPSHRELGTQPASSGRLDARSLVAELDGRGADGFALLGPRLEGLAEPHVLVLRFEETPPAEQATGASRKAVEGEISTGAWSEGDGSPPRLALVIDGWVAWMTSDVSRALLQARRAWDPGDEPAPTGNDDTPSPPSPACADTEAGEGLLRFAASNVSCLPGPWGPALEVRSGGVLLADADLGLPIGASLVAPLPEGAATPLEARIGSNLSIYYDRIRLGRLVNAPLTVRELPPARADLRWRGVAALRRHHDARPTDPDYDFVSPLSPFRRLPGETTVPGDVLSLVSETDGRFALFGTGEEIALDFDAGALPAPRPGHARTWFLVSTGYARDGDPNTEPLPWGEASAR